MNDTNRVTEKESSTSNLHCPIQTRPWLWSAKIGFLLLCVARCRSMNACLASLCGGRMNELNAMNEMAR